MITMASCGTTVWLSRPRPACRSLSRLVGLEFDNFRPPITHQVPSSNGRTEPEFPLKRNSPNKQQQLERECSRGSRPIIAFEMEYLDHPLLPPPVSGLHTNAGQGCVRRRPLAFAFAIREPETLGRVGVPISNSSFYYRRFLVVCLRPSQSTVDRTLQADQIDRYMYILYCSTEYVPTCMYMWGISK